MKTHTPDDLHTLEDVCQELARRWGFRVTLTTIAELIKASTDAEARKSIYSLIPPFFLQLTRDNLLAETKAKALTGEDEADWHGLIYINFPRITGVNELLYAKNPERGVFLSRHIDENEPLLNRLATIDIRARNAQTILTNDGINLNGNAPTCVQCYQLPTPIKPATAYRYLTRLLD